MNGTGDDCAKQKSSRHNTSGITCGRTLLFYRLPCDFALRFTSLLCQLVFLLGLANRGTREGHKARWGRRHFHLLVCFVWTHHMLPLPACIARLQFHPSVVIRSSQVSSHFTAHDSYSFTNNSIMWLVVPSQKFSQVLSFMFRTTDPSEKSPLLSHLRLGSAESLL